MNYTLKERKGDILSDLLRNRGIENKNDIDAFLLPDYDNHTHDPFLMLNMEKVVNRIYEAVKSGEKIAIWSDYDADGIPGAVVLHDGFKKIGYDNFENYIPHRHDEGFGLNKEGIDELASGGTKLIITIDCGISNVIETEYANSLGIDVIITDHHLPHENLPPAFSILNPKLNNCNYPEKMLCGSGVIFKFIQAFFKKHGDEFGVKKGWEKWFLDMVGIATMSDMVPLVGENRVFAFYGLKVLQKTSRPGLLKLFSKLRLKQAYINEDDIGFTITPRINAASRMGEPEHAFNLLSATDESSAGVYVEKLEHVNNERKGTVASLVKEIKKILKERDLTEKKVIVIGNPLWRPSLLGLVANSVAEEFKKPAFIWGRDGSGILKGSCRSLGFGNVVEIMNKAADCFEEYGGHAMSGGFAIKDEKIHVFDELLNEVCYKLEEEKNKKDNGIDKSQEMVHGLFIDREISLEDVSWDLYKQIEKLAPFGTGNQKPVFLIKKANIKNVKKFGKEGDHTEIILLDSNGRKISAIQFFSSRSPLPSHIIDNSSADFVVHLEKSNFKNYPELRLRIIDVF